MKRKLLYIMLAVIILVSSLTSLSSVSFAEEEKTFTVSLITDQGEVKLGDFDNFYRAGDSIVDNDTRGKYIVTINKDYRVRDYEFWISDLRKDVTFRSKEGHRFTL